MSRPKKDPAKRLSEVVTLRLTPAEADVINRAAVRKGISVSVFVRRCIEAVCEKQRAVGNPVE